VCRATYRGFKSLILRKKSLKFTFYNANLIGEIIRLKTISVLTLTIILGQFSISGAKSSEVYAVPELVTFTFTPSEIELTAPSSNVKFELVVSHPIGIENSKVRVTLLSQKNNKLVLELFRTKESIINSLQTITFAGSIDIPRDFEPDVYKVESDPVIGAAARGSDRNTISLPFKVTKKSNNIVGAESDLLIRRNGFLNYNYPTFVGPTHETTFSIAREMPKLSKISEPIWKVGETYSPSDFYELRVPELELKVSSNTPQVCESDGKKLTFVQEGSCSFLVFTSKNINYMYKKDEQLATITKARIVQELLVENINDQSSVGLPKIIKIPRVTSGILGFVSPKTLTPSICLVSDGFVNIFSGGTCKYSYQSESNSNFLSSKTYELSFEITRDPQTVTLTLPSTANVSTRSIALTATASGGGSITYSTTSAGICSITGSTLNLLRNGNCSVTATQAGTSTLAPASATATVVLSGTAVANRKTITCVKGKSTKRVSGVNPKCPRGFKIKR
jgi:hypothetical protein